MVISKHQLAEALEKRLFLNYRAVKTRVDKGACVSRPLDKFHPH